jgi:pyruvate dehydrogenase (quinone)
VQPEQKSEGLLPTYTDLKNPNFAKVAQAIGLWGRTVTDAAEFESAVDEWLAVSGPALLNVKVAPMELVMPPFIAPEAAYGMAMYSVRAVLHGQAGDVSLVLFGFLHSVLHRPESASSAKKTPT